MEKEIIHNITLNARQTLYLYTYLPSGYRYLPFYFKDFKCLTFIKFECPLISDLN